MRVGVYSPYLDTLGGGERYFLTVADFFLKHNHSVDLFWQGETSLEKINDRFGIDLTGARFVQGYFDDSKDRWKRYLKTFKYGLFFFVSDGSIPLSFSRKTIIHFQVPFTKVKYSPFNQWKLNRSIVVCNSFFTKKYIDQTYKINSTVLYPPIDIENFTPGKKENIILGVGRFFAPLHPKKQEEMVKAFKDLKTNWELVLIGGVTGEESKKSVENLRKMADGYKIKILTDSSIEVLKDYYAKAKLYWHAAGFGEDLEKFPERAEHFGMSTVEAMAAGCVPIVFSGGGQREIIEDGDCGYLWTSLEELISDTQQLMKNEQVRESMAKKAIKKSKDYSKENFYEKLQQIV